MFTLTLAKARAAWSRLVNLPEPNPTAIAEARVRVEEMEVELAGLSREFKEQRTHRSLEWRQVAAALPAGSALLSLRTFLPVNFKTRKPDEPRWLALLIPAGAEDESAIILKDIGPAGLVAEAFARLRDTESNGDAQALYALLFGELDGALAKYDTLLSRPRRDAGSGGLRPAGLAGQAVLDRAPAATPDPRRAGSCGACLDNGGTYRQFFFAVHGTGSRHSLPG